MVLVVWWTPRRDVEGHPIFRGGLQHHQQHVVPNNSTAIGMRSSSSSPCLLWFIWNFVRWKTMNFLPSLFVPWVAVALFVAANLVATYKYHLFTKRHLCSTFISDDSWWYTRNHVKRVAYPKSILLGIRCTLIIPDPSQLNWAATNNIT